MSFGIPESTFLKQIETDLEEEVINLAERVFVGVTSRTPVRTGQTRQSWNMSVGSPDLSTVDSGGTPGNPLPSPVIPKIKYKAFKRIHISNAKKHILYLEYGSPTTVPSAMVRATLSSL